MAHHLSWRSMSSLLMGLEESHSFIMGELTLSL
jgi:hypothetical protein